MGFLSRKTALVTGGGTGVGAAIALALANEGANVTVAGRREAVLDNVADQNDRIQTHTVDVTDAASVKALFDGIGPIDIAVANAGAAESAPFSMVNADHWRRMLDVNLSGVFHIFQSSLPSMVSRGSGRLISIASTAGLKGYSYVAPYCAAKHGVIGLTRALALETATKGITVNAICPGFVDTPLLDNSVRELVQKTGRTTQQAQDALAANNPQKRLIQPDEVAATVLWLCQEASAGVSGQAISICGGETG